MLQVLGYGMLILGFLLLAVSVFLIFIWKIPDILDEISGRKAKRQIKKLKELNVGLNESSSFSSNDLYEVVHSGNLVWESIDGSKESRTNFEENNEDENAEISEGDETFSKQPESDIPQVSENNKVEAEKESDEEISNKVTVVIIKEQSSLKLEEG